MEMDFTFDAYRKLISLLKENEYKVRDYQNIEGKERIAILRHDVDFDLKKALHFARFESELGVASTYFILLSSDFYNLFSKNTLNIVQEISRCGHKIGLHFDETNYSGNSMEEMKGCIEKEIKIMEELLNTPIRTVSMHRPSKTLIKENLQIPGITNSYGSIFLQQFKYLSDSRMYWRENIYTVIQSGEFQKLHILTHPFWYTTKNEKIQIKLERFLKGSYEERYKILNQNFYNLREYISLEKG